MKYRFIFLDVDGTLLDFQACEAAAFRKACGVFGIAWSQEIYEIYHELNAELWERHESGELTREDLLRTRFGLLFERIGVVGDGVAFEEKYREYLAEGAYIENGAPELLQRLKAAGCRIYLVTNGLHNTQDRRLHESGIGRFADGIFISEDIGWQKPTKAYFDYCFARVPGFRREEAVIVGDSLTADVRGGQNAGIAACWYNPQGKDNRGIRAEMEARSLDEVWRLLGGGEP